MDVLSLTENGVLSAPGLTCSSIHVEVCVSVWAPLAQNARTRVDHVYEVSVRRVKVMGPVGSHVKQDGWIQTCNSFVLFLLFCFGANGY